MDKQRSGFGARLRLFLIAWSGFVALAVAFLVIQALPAFHEARYSARMSLCISLEEPDRAHAFLERTLRDAGVAHWSLGEADRPLEGCAGYEQRVLEFEAVLARHGASALFDRFHKAGPEAGVYSREFSYQTSPAGTGGGAYAVASSASAVLALGFWWIVRRRGGAPGSSARAGARTVLGGALAAAGLALAAAVAYGFVLQAAGIMRMPERSSPDSVTPLLLLTAAVLAPIAEEVVFRFWLLGRMVPAIGPAAALLLSSAVFAMVHMELEPFALGSRLITGLALGLLWLRTSSLRACVLAHGLFNAAVIGLDQLVGRA